MMTRKCEHDEVDHIGTEGDGRLDPDSTTIPGECECGGQTWPMEEDGVHFWQCEMCGECY